MEIIGQEAESKSNKKLVGYTTLMCPEAMNLPYLETLLSWSHVCDKIAICYSKFPKMDLKVPDGAVCPWKEDDTLDILKKFDEEMLDNKLVLYQHEWNPDFPREDGKTKQLARNLAISVAGSSNAWTAQFDADEVLREQDSMRIIEFVEDQIKKPTK